MKNTMMARIASVSAALTATLMLSTGVFAQEMTIKHAAGETVLPAAPQKILVLDINSLDIIHALGGEVSGVVGSNLPSYLSEYSDDKYVKIGTLFEPDYEAIAAEDADLIIIGGRSRAKFPELSAILPTIDLSVDNADLFNSIRSNVETLGEVFGKQEKATELVATFNEKVDALKAVAPEAGTAITLVTNAGSIGVYGPASRTGWLHNEIGFKPVIENIDDRFHGGDSVSFEFILETNPNWMFVVDRDAGTAGGVGEAAKAVLDNELVNQTDAWKNNHIVYLDPVASYIVSAGYTAVTTLIDQVYTAVTAK